MVHISEGVYLPCVILPLIYPFHLVFLTLAWPKGFFWPAGSRLARLSKPSPGLQVTELYFIHIVLNLICSQRHLASQSF